MKRKIIKLAEKTLVISLPSQWILENKLEKGEEIELSYIDNSIMLSPLNLKSKIKQISIDINNISERVLRWQIASLHKQGYDEIIVTSYTEEQFKTIQDLIEHLFIGFIIKEKTKLKIVIGQIAVTDATEFDSTLRRTFRQVIKMFEELYDAFKTNDLLLLSNQINLEHENNKLTNFCCRLLNQTLKEKENGHFWYVIAWNLETIADIFKHIAKHYKMALPKLNKIQMDILNETNDYIKGYYECFYSFEMNKLVQLDDQRQKLLIKINQELQNSNKETIILMHYLSMLVYSVTDFSGSMIAIRNKP